MFSWLSDLPSPPVLGNYLFTFSRPRENPAQFGALIGGAGGTRLYRGRGFALADALPWRGLDPVVEVVAGRDEDEDVGGLIANSF